MQSIVFRTMDIYVLNQEINDFLQNDVVVHHMSHSSYDSDGFSFYSVVIFFTSAQ